MDLVKRLVLLNYLPIWRRQVRVWGRRITAPSLDRLVCLLLHRCGLMGRADRSFFERHVRRGMAVVDAGANQGLYAIFLSYLVGDHGSVMAFEPEPEMFSILRHNCQVNEAHNVRCYPVALGAQSGTASLSRCLVHGGDNRLGHRHPRAISNTVSVPITTLDEAAENRRIDFVKIDVQGWEGAVFRGMERVIQTNPGLEIYFEYSPRSLAEAGTTAMDILQWLNDRGFHLFDCSTRTPSPIHDFAAFTGSLTGRKYTNVYATRSNGST